MIHNLDEPKSKPSTSEVGQNTAGTFGNTGTINANANNGLGKPGKAMTYFSSNMRLMSANKAAEYVTTIYSNIVDAYSHNEELKKTKVLLLDKDIMSGLAYSYIVVSRKDTKINYFVIVLEATGRKPLLAEEISNEYATMIKTGKPSRNMFTTGDAINGKLRAIISEQLKTLYKSEIKEPIEIVSADGFVFPHTVDDIEVASRCVAAIAFNALNVLSVLQNPNNLDLNIAEGNKETGNAILDFVSSISRTTAYDEFNTPIRADWKTELVIRQQNQGLGNINYAEELNSENTQNVLTKVCGFVEAYPEELITPLTNGAIMKEIRFHPYIVITDIAPAKPTIGFMLLGLVSSLVMTNKNMWLASLMPDGSKYHVGALNTLADIEGLGRREVLDFEAVTKNKERKYSPDKVYSIVSEMFKLEPVVCMDIPDYGAHTYYTSVLSAAASGINNQNTTGALKTIVETAHVLTNGVFPLEFDIGSIFAHEGVLIPLGTWREPKTGNRRDIRDIDLTMVATEEPDIEVMKSWIASNTPARISNIDPYMAKIDVISRIMPKAEITGRGVRVTFSKVFIETLSSAATQAGLVVRYEPEMNLLEQNNLSITSGVLRNATLGNVSGFARQNVAAGPNFHMNYINSGGYRFY